MRGFLALALIVAGALIAPHSAKAQRAVLGVTAGASRAHMVGDDVVSSDWRWGPVLGASLFAAVSSSFALSLEVNYVERGSSNVEFSTAPDTFDFKISYFEVPIFMNFVLPLSEVLRINVYTGIGPAFRLTCKARDNVGSFERCPDGSFGEDARAVDWQFGFGAGLVGALGGSSAIGLDARYLRGLENTFESQSARLEGFEIVLRYFIR